MINWLHINHFDPREFTQPDDMDEGLIMTLDAIREEAGVPIYITSSFRQGDEGAHGEGKAIDISDNLEGNDLSSRWRFLVLRSLFRNDINRIGDYNRHLHADVSQSRDQEVCWHGISD